MAFNTNIFSGFAYVSIHPLVCGIYYVLGETGYGSHIFLKFQFTTKVYRLGMTFAYQWIVNLF
jgi:hypothetical protein